MRTFHGGFKLGTFDPPCKAQGEENENVLKGPLLGEARQTRLKT